MPDAPAAEAARVLTVADLMDAYLADRRNPFAERPCKTPTSLDYHLRATRALWGAMPVSLFAQGSKQRVKAKCQEWRAAGASPYTVRKRISILKTVFRFAIDEELITRADEPVIKLPPNGAPRERFVDPKTELVALLAAADHSATPFHIRLNFHVSLRTGQRQGAIRALQWSKHIDFENRVILFRETEAVQDRSKKRRTNIPMDDQLLALLRDAKERADTDWVLEWRGKQVSNCYHGMKALYRRAGVHNLRLHDLRRTAATYVHRGTQGDMKAAASFIGDTEQIAQKHYVRQSPETLLRPVSAIADVMAEAHASRPHKIGLPATSLALLRHISAAGGEWVLIENVCHRSAATLANAELIECDPPMRGDEGDLRDYSPFRARLLPTSENIADTPNVRRHELDAPPFGAVELSESA